MPRTNRKSRRRSPRERKRLRGYQKRGWNDKDERHKNAYADIQNRNAYSASRAAYGESAHEQKLFDQGYKLDEELSGERDKVYYDPSGELPPIVAFRGTQDATDIGADWSIVNGKYEGAQFDRAGTLIDLAEARYGKGIVTGHSLGGTKAIVKGNERGHHVIAFNPGTGVWELDAGDATVFKTEGDWISSRIRGNNIYGASGGHSIGEFEDEFYPETPMSTIIERNENVSFEASPFIPKQKAFGRPNEWGLGLHRIKREGHTQGLIIHEPGPMIHENDEGFDRDFRNSNTERSTNHFYEAMFQEGYE